MTDIFQSSNLRLLNANGHINNLHKKIKAFIDTKPYNHIIEPDSEGINQLHKIKFTEPLPDEFATIAADAVDNLRSALDQIWYAIAIVSEAIKPSREANFPFADNLTKFERILIKGCKNFPKDILAHLRSFQPYKGGNDLLWALNRICAANKHRMLAPIGILVGGIQINKMTFRGTGGIPFPTWDRTKHEIIYAIVGPNGNIEYDINIIFDIAFNEVEIVSGQPVIAVLRNLATIVKNIIINLETEIMRLGYV